ncbi:MAG TPA: DUF3368 domain-containing protein [Candidatus Nanoarchaeia archaeon]|nr:DUF3368 domain-containing protein [Candidatus Nanoarchaeia archaeon]
MISDSSPLIILGKLNKLELLAKVFGKIEIVKSVYNEVVEEGKKSGKAEAFDIEELIENKKILIRNLDKDAMSKSSFLQKSYSKLGIGEADSLALSLAEKQKEILIDEAFARKVARIHGIKPIGVLRVLLIAYKRGIIEKNIVKEIFDKIMLEDFRVGANVLQEFLLLFDKVKRK